MSDREIQYMQDRIMNLRSRLSQIPTRFSRSGLSAVSSDIKEDPISPVGEFTFFVCDTEDDLPSTRPVHSIAACAAEKTIWFSFGVSSQTWRKMVFRA